LYHTLANGRTIGWLSWAGGTEQTTLATGLTPTGWRAPSATPTSPTASGPASHC